MFYAQSATTVVVRCDSFRISDHSNSALRGRHRESAALFGKGADGSEPESSLIFDASGNLYGTTGRGGAYGYGTVFKLAPNSNGTWNETLLHSFNKHGKDGYNPDASLIFDAAGSLYGVTSLGGSRRRRYGLRADSQSGRRLGGEDSA